MKVRISRLLTQLLSEAEHRRRDMLKEIWCRIKNQGWHDYQQPTYVVREGKEYEILVCGDCGNVSEAWRPM